MKEKIKNVKELNDWFHSLSDKEKCIAYATLGDGRIDYVREMEWCDVMSNCGCQTLEEVINQWDNNTTKTDKLCIYRYYHDCDFDEYNISQYLDCDDPIEFSDFISSNELCDLLNTPINQRPFISKDALVKQYLEQKTELN